MLTVLTVLTVFVITSSSRVCLVRFEKRSSLAPPSRRTQSAYKEYTEDTRGASVHAFSPENVQERVQPAASWRRNRV